MHGVQHDRAARRDANLVVRVLNVATPSTSSGRPVSRPAKSSRSASSSPNSAAVTSVSAFVKGEARLLDGPRACYRRDDPMAQYGFRIQRRYAPECLTDDDVWRGIERMKDVGFRLFKIEPSKMVMERWNSCAAQGFDGVESCGLHGRVQAECEADAHGGAERQDYGFDTWQRSVAGQS